MARINNRIDSKFIDLTLSGKEKKRKEHSLPPRNEREANLILDRLWDRNPILALTCQMSALTGLRYSDASWLKFSDFYDEFGSFKTSFKLCQQKTFNMRIGSKNPLSPPDAFRKSVVTIYTNSDILEIVEQCKVFNPNSEYLFANKRSALKDSDSNVIDRPMSTESASWHHAIVRKELELPYVLGTHSWRKYFAKLLIQHGATPEKVRDLLGQKSLESTNLYLHTVEEELVPLIKNISLNL
ncbi:tyrosine-type recombinase/integrase [Photobacterium leiognathi]|uniref:tyrosine-type recombinase/integrase n=1 Tax=Photobacterium leiognathi TaxID=553611 RepID=UPI00273A01AA|nr:tyrosine-type recombinase/integrase [Photobacterium leiognathi]